MRKSKHLIKQLFPELVHVNCIYCPNIVMGKPEDCAGSKKEGNP
jgi:hypothetical protein